jgi:hypothetical protein
LGLLSLAKGKVFVFLSLPLPVELEVEVEVEGTGCRKVDVVALCRVFSTTTGFLCKPFELIGVTAGFWAGFSFLGTADDGEEGRAPLLGVLLGKTGPPRVDDDEGGAALLGVLLGKTGLLQGELVLLISFLFI